MKHKKHCGIFVTGATGSGKSSAIFSLSSTLPIEVISVDSRQLYKHAYVGTCAPTEQEKQHFPHHLVHYLDLSEVYSAGKFVQDAKKISEEILKRERIPVFVGGTLFYMKALWDGLIKTSKVSDKLYNEVQEKVNMMSLEEQFTLLKTLDLDGANQVEPTDRYRIRKFVEYALLENSPISSASKQGGIYKNTSFYSSCIEISRSVLYNNINKRTEKMFEENKIIKEVLTLLSYSSSMQDTLFQTIGYKQICNQIKIFCTKKDILYTKDTLVEHQVSLEKYLEQSKKLLIQEISRDTRRYAKRQETCFRHESRLNKVPSEKLSALLNKNILLCLEDLVS